MCLEYQHARSIFDRCQKICDEGKPLAAFVAVHHVIVMKAILYLKHQICAKNILANLIAVQSQKNKRTSAAFSNFFFVAFSVFSPCTNHRFPPLNSASSLMPGLSSKSFVASFVKAVSLLKCLLFCAYLEHGNAMHKVRTHLRSHGKKQTCPWCSCGEKEGPTGRARNSMQLKKAALYPFRKSLHFWFHWTDRKKEDHHCKRKIVTPRVNGKRPFIGSDHFTPQRFTLRVDSRQRETYDGDGKI